MRNFSRGAQQYFSRFSARPLKLTFRNHSHDGTSNREKASARLTSDSDSSRENKKNEWSNDLFWTSEAGDMTTYIFPSARSFFGFRGHIAGTRCQLQHHSLGVIGSDTLVYLFVPQVPSITYPVRSSEYSCKRVPIFWHFQTL